MFRDTALQNHLETSSSIQSQALVVAEWNMNYFDNIKAVGNYRYRPADSDSKYFGILNTFDEQDTGNFYTDATNADVLIDGGVDDDGTPTTFLSAKQKEKLLYSLEDCFGRFRPRSGINKARYFEYNKYLHHSNSNMARRPRYYPGHKNDFFKYWSSYRTEDGIERGIANNLAPGNSYYIDDAAPFVVYKDPVPTNKIVVKMQTNVGDIDLGPFSSSSGSFNDPFYGEDNATVPSDWSIQYLTANGSWSTAISFNGSSSRANGDPIIRSDGYVEISYGLQIPETYLNTFRLISEITSERMLPDSALLGHGYLLKQNATDIGVLKIWNGTSYDSYNPQYGWSVTEDGINAQTQFVSAFNQPSTFTSTVTGQEQYREFEYIYGLRVVARTMTKVDSTLDLIELSPRLLANLSNYTIEYDVNKSASDLGITGMPVGQLLASTGSITLFDYDNSFNPNNQDSILSQYLAKNIQFKFYEVILGVDNYDYFVPIKTLYSDGFPSYSSRDRTVNLILRDLFFYFESITAPQILVTDVSLSYAVSLLLDSIGFSNYTFKRTSSDIDPVIPFFFIGPDTNVATILEQLARSAQCAMFFDEYNNFVLMNKNYIMPSLEERVTDTTLYGSTDFEKDGVIKNNKTNSKLANIIEVSSDNNNVYNGGQINYTSRYIQKSYGSIRQASLVDKEKTWIYQPAYLWEVSASENTKSINNQTNSQSSYVLSAIPLNSNLSDSVPSVSGHQLRDNVIDLGEAVYWISRYNGYFYSSGEVIRYDAVQYNVSGISGDTNVWISSVQEYSNYFGKLKFNGKIYPTGLVKIYTEPYYETVNGTTRLKNGAVRKHGRGQFGTSVVHHSAGIDPYWTDDNNVYSSLVDSRHLFSSVSEEDAGIAIEPVSANNSTRNGIIKNFMSTEFIEDSAVGKIKTIAPGTIQSSALIVNGPSYTVNQNALNYVTYINKPLTDRFVHFGTRMRIIGKIENNENTGQTVVGGSTYYTLQSNSPSQNTTISGGSGGIACMLNPSTESGEGYYYEIIALSETNIEAYDNAENVHNIIFYKTTQGSNVPTKLWGGLSKIIVDTGKFTGQARMVGEENPTVYDLALEYQDIGKIRRFYLYLNAKLIAIVDDESPLPKYNNMAVFVRGSSRCMFENIYAIANNYSQNTSYAIDTPIMPAIVDDEVNANEAFSKYALSGVVQATYLSGISPSEPPKYNIYYEEFGSIMREVAYFDIKYDKAYPALYAKIAPTFNGIKGYAASGFIAGSYGAEFLIFNCTDTVLSLDASSGNYLRILGITFTQQSPETLTVDDYFQNRGDFSRPAITANGEIVSPLISNNEYLDIKSSRATYGSSEFSLDLPYVQTEDEARELMGWIISKVMKPRKSVGLQIFANPTIQLGDIVELEYEDSTGARQVSSGNSRFVVYSTSYFRNSDGPSMEVYLSEVK